MAEPNIVEPSATLVDPLGAIAGAKLLTKIETCGRISHRSEDAQGEETWRRFIPAVVLGHGDWSIVEHASATVLFVVDRGITHEIVRHRLASYTQESTRFVNYEKKMPPSFVMPQGVRDNDEDHRKSWLVAVTYAEESYRDLLERGFSPQIARSVLPNALAAKLVMTCNLRNWRHFLLMRTTIESHPQMRQVTIPLLEQFKQTIPLLFDDIEPNARQVENLRKPR